MDRLGTLVLGSEPRQRARMQRALMAAGLCVTAMVLLGYGIAAGFVARFAGLVLLAYLGSGLVLFYAALRSGWNRRFHDPGLTLAQMAFAVTGMTAAYAIAGPARGGFLLLLACAMVFGVYTRKPGHARIACAATLALLAVVIWTMTLLDPARYPPLIEATHLVLSAIALPTIAWVAIELLGAREKLKARNAELSAALLRVQLLASRDELTGLANRRLLDECLERESMRVRRNQTSACVCLLDLDHFKRINDSHGHAAGDLVLKEFAHIAHTTARASDIVGRWGGEEFLWLLPDTGIDEARRAVERLRAAFTSCPLWRQRPELLTTFSAGLTIMHPRDDRTAVLKRADVALYQAKREGRDRAEFECRVVTLPGRLGG